MVRAFLSLLISLIFAEAAFSAEKVALVIGNSKYQHVEQLPNAANDAADVRDALKRLGFRVVAGIDLSRVEILTLAQSFQKSLKPEDIALFYFSGHAMQIGAENFIIPVDVSGENEEMIKARSVKLQAILADMERSADRNIIVLDACRNNPFDIPASGRAIGGASGGLAKVDAGVDSFIAFSTQPGNVASDGYGRNSPFTAAFLRYLPSREDDLHEVMRKVRRDVVEETNSEQIPWENSSLIEQIYLGNEAAADYAEVQLPGSGAQYQASRFTYEVAGLDPYGDGFLALRSGTTSSAKRLLKMTEGARLEVLEQDGVWFKVRTEAGALGWAHSNWIRFTGTGSHQAHQVQQTTCDSLWYERNAIFARNGYCFKSARGQQAFSNEGCRAGVAADNIPLSPAETNEVNRIVALEKRMQCN